MKRFRIFIALGVLNILHAGVHGFQFLQSIILTYYSISHKNDTWIHSIMESPWMGLLWGLLGILTLYIGYNDYKHHKEHND